MQSNLKAFRIALMLVLSLFFGTVSAQTVTGNVVDETGEAVIGATVMEKGTKNATVTDFDGNFTIKMEGGNVLTISYIGMQSQDVNVAGKTSVNVVLKEDATTLQDVVVVGYGTMKKTDLTGSVSSVNTEQLNAKGAPSVMENLQGAVPGVNITQTSGRAGGDFNIEIRGKNSISSDQGPLYVVDGVICSDINFLNPQDIERIDVLKDASSTAIYGSRATAGVVMVTTKSGTTVNKQATKPTISYDGYYGITKIARLPDLMDGETFYQYRFQKFLEAANGITDGHPTLVPGNIAQALLQSNTTGEYRLKTMLASGETQDWIDLMTRTGSQQNHYIAVSGAGEKINYHMGLGYNKENGIYRGDSQDKFSFKGSLDAQINKIISGGFSFNVARINHDYASDEAIKFAWRMNPYMQPYDSEGNLNMKPGNATSIGTGTGGNQFSDQISPLFYATEESSNRETWRMMGNFYVQAKILDGLTFKTTFSPNFSYWREGYFKDNLENPEEAKQSRNRTNRGFDWTWDNMLTYDKTFKQDHHINLMGLFSLNYANSENMYMYFNNVTDGTTWWNLNTGEYDQDKSSNGYSESSLVSYAFRANYSYKGRYMATATVRRDGSSRFTEGNRWGSFPSFALAWRASEESFLQKAEWLSNLKLRLSYGVTGNNSVGNYATRQFISSPVYYPFSNTYQQGFYPGSPVNKDLQWEMSHEFNIGVDFGFLNERIRGTIDWYTKKSTDLLYEVELPLEAGGVKMQTNIGSVRNTGLEISLTTVNVQSKDWYWSTTFNFATNKNKVLEVNSAGGGYLTGSPTGNLIIGEPYNNVYTYEWTGIVSDQDMTVPNHEVARNNGFTPGSTVKQSDYYYKCYGLIEGNPIIDDKNGDGKYNDDDKKVYRSDPAWTGSFTTDLSWKNIDFSMSLYAKINYDVFSNFYSEYFNVGDRGRGRMNADWYIPAGTLIDCDGMNEDGTLINPKYQETTHYGDYPFINNAAGNSGVGTAYWLDTTNAIADATYVKVKHISLGYTFPKNWTNKFGCSHLRLYCTVTNPFVFTKYKGFDPEWANAALKNDGPSTVTYQFGASIKF